ncbi:ABC-type amino acid transport substrate-binding protein [Pseudorhizobium tarimense]|uniref:ABC-type amino acid transport substrate-binding protein n=1 Tax=Pseudorhizobium tarimense TaxID=1079109 RepID=A0ABV2H6Y9_9HYPH|nr:transporter substrate-binding domain-containing protein [Pseudorhizobium tarimense]MCJ8519353.1 transporter substrate-binding domain-containing protein [Pseudorhizobium tarimense]
MTRLASLLFACLTAATCAHADEPLIFTTEAYPPFSFREQDGTNRGGGIDQLKAMIEEIGRPYDIQIMPWARAIALAETQPMHCVFAAARTPEREGRFKWVIPLFVNRSILVAREDSP